MTKKKSTTGSRGVPARTRLGPDRILAPIGAGGMGEVYRTRDNALTAMVLEDQTAAGRRRQESDALAIAPPRRIHCGLQGSCEHVRVRAALPNV